MSFSYSIAANHRAYHPVVPLRRLYVPDLRYSVIVATTGTVKRGIPFLDGFKLAPN
jgi:hypothetical protein